jgi:hypothetical protein
MILLFLSIGLFTSFIQTYTFSYTINMLINIHQAAIYTKKELKEQKVAWDYLQSVLTEQEVLKFADLYRTQPPTPVIVKPTKAYKFPLQLISQRLNIGDWNADGKQEWVQTCLPTSVTMAIKAYTGSAITVKEVDQIMRVRYGNRYSHDNAVKALRQFEIQSVFSTSTNIDIIKKHLQNGNLVIWSNLITHSGHIVLLAGYENGKFLVYDPYGEPSIGASGKPFYTDSRKPYLLSEAAFKRFTANTALNHWAHLLSS